MRGININDPYTYSYLGNAPYSAPEPGLAWGGPGTAPVYLDLPDAGSGPTAGNDVIVGTIGQLKGSHINGLGGYNIFQLENTPGVVTGSVPVPGMGFEYHTVDTAGLLNSLRNFQEIDFSFFGGGDAQYGVDAIGFGGVQVDASKLNIKTLGLVSTGFGFLTDGALTPLASVTPLDSFEPLIPIAWGSFANLSSSNLVIAKSSNAVLPGAVSVPLDGGLELEIMSLQALRTTPVVLDPLDALFPTAAAHGGFAQGGLVKLQINAAEVALVLPSIIGQMEGFPNWLSDYKTLSLSGAGMAVVDNLNGFFMGGVPLSARNDNIKIDASAMSGSLFVMNNSVVKENILFPKVTTELGLFGISGLTMLAGSTLGKMDVVSNAKSGDQVLFSSAGFILDGQDGVPDAYVPAVIDPPAPAHGGAEQLVAKGTSLQNQFLLAERQSIADSKVVWFVGADRNTYILDAYANMAPTFDSEPLGSAPVSGRHGASVANPNDFVIELMGVHTVDLLGYIDGGAPA